MKKTLVVLSHPRIETSVVNQRWMKEIKKYPDQFTVHDLYKAYPDWQIDVKQEQALIESHGGLVLQFPLYWFNCPPLLKKWLDEVMTYGWAYGRTGTQLKGRKMGIAVSAGIRHEDFSEKGQMGASLPEVLRPFEMVAHYIRADYQPLFAFHGAISDPGVGPQYTQDQLEQSARDYVAHLKLLASV